MTRIVTNYLRLLGTFVIGIWLVRLLLTFGNDVYALVVLLGAGQGITAILKDMARASVVPALASAFHKDNGSRFLGMYNAALISSSAAAILTAFLFGGFYVACNWLQIPDNLRTAAQLFVVFKGTQSVLTIMLSPVFNMYVVHERMGAYNFWTLIERGCDLTAALIVMFVLGITDHANVVAQYGLWSTLLCVAALFASCIWMVSKDSRLLPRPWQATYREFRSLIRSGSENSAVVLANNLYFRTDALIANIFFGLSGNLIFGIAAQFVSYLRVFAMGLVTGLDAISARVSNSAHCENEHMKQLVRQATTLQGVVVFPLTVVLLVLTRPLLDLWIGARVNNPTETLPSIVALSHVLILGVAMRSIGEPWISILSGARQLATFARLVLLGGLANLIFVVLLARLLPPSIAFLAPGWVYTPLAVALYLVAVPKILAAYVKIGYWNLLSALAKPLVAAIVCLPVFSMFARFPVGSVAQLACSSIAYGIMYLCVCYLLVLRPEHRGKFRDQAAAVVRRLTSGLSQPTPRTSHQETDTAANRESAPPNKAA